MAEQATKSFDPQVVGVFSGWHFPRSENHVFELPKYHERIFGVQFFLVKFIQGTGRWSLVRFLDCQPHRCMITWHHCSKRMGMAFEVPQFCHRNIHTFSVNNAGEGVNRTITYFILAGEGRLCDLGGGPEQLTGVRGANAQTFRQKVRASIDLLSTLELAVPLESIPIPTPLGARQIKWRLNSKRRCTITGRRQASVAVRGTQGPTTE